MNVLWVISCVIGFVCAYFFAYSLCVVAGRADDEIEKRTGRRMS